MSQKFRKARFKGVEFFVGESQTSAGRRSVLHEYPQRDTPFSEDLGRKAREFQVEGYVLGADALAQSDRLMTAIESEGPGTLVHPYYGERVVICSAFQIKNAAAENKITRFSITFQEAGEDILPKASPDSAFKVTSATDALRSASASDFEKAFSVAKQAQFVVQSAVLKIKSVTARLKSLTGNAAALYQSAANLAFALRNMEAAAIDLVNSPKKMREQIEESMRLLSTTFDRLLNRGSRQSFTAQTALLLFGASDEVVTSQTPSRKREEGNRVAVNSLVKRMALANAAEQAVQLQFESTEDAAKVRSTLLDAIDTLSDEATSDDVYVALRDLAAAVSQAIPRSEENLPSLITVTADQTLPALALCYRIFGTVDSESDLVSRNRIRHPGFIGAGSDLKVLGK